MTPTQKNFRKMMKELENEGKIPKQFNHKKKRRSYKKFIPIIAVILLIWNKDALYTLISPHLENSIDFYNISSPIGYDSNLVGNLAMQSEHQMINDYLNTGRMINEKLNAIVRRAFKRTGDGDKYSVEEIDNELRELEVFKEEKRESMFEEYRINHIYLANIKLIA